ncbi:MAG: hypothetical protein BWY10_02135 [Chloroflexi bacterium ADurb.Bin180]|nr:MAG: hypothetical protein BWY10_02135 [Chloroflexi bacterium ADurb.Bin180]
MALAFDDIINEYENLVEAVAAELQAHPSRARAGIIRSIKGKFVEKLCRSLVQNAWDRLGGAEARLTFVHAPVRIPLHEAYLSRLENPELADYIKKHIHKYVYEQKMDVPVCVDETLVMAIESKAYAENAMMKRVLVDFALLKHVHPSLRCVLIQLESMLGGDYSEISSPLTLGSFPTHTLLSYFDVHLHIITLLAGERRVNREILDPRFHKPLDPNSLEQAVTVLRSLLKDYL